MIRLFLLFAISILLPAADSAACAKCHAEIVRSYARTPMAVSSGRSGTGLHPPRTAGTFTDPRSIYQYRVGHDPKGWFFSFGRKSEPNSTRRLPWYVGSGSAASAFLIDVDGFLYEAPVTWYGRTQSWDLSPGYQNYAYPFLTRAITPGCLECHASGVQWIPGTQNAYASLPVLPLMPFREGGVSCGRCHGNGELHAQGKGKILNPVKLAPRQRDSICAQCHLSGEIRVDRAGKQHRPFLAGDDLQDHTTAFIRTGGLNGSRVTSHVENLAQSACAKASGDRLWCGTCHDPHTLPAPGKKAAWFQAKCQTCHAPSACRAGQTQNCIACHMPRNSTVDADHVVQTDHSIPRRATTRSTAKPAPDAPLAAFGKAVVSPRDLGLAYAIVAVRENNKVYAGRAFDLLREAVKSAPEDPQTLSYLADLYKKRNDDTSAIRLYETLLRADPTDSSAPTALGAYAMERGDLDTAIRLWNDALRKSPALLLVRANLASALLQKNRPTEARAVLLKALEFNPEFKAAQDLLKMIR